MYSLDTLKRMHDELHQERVRKAQEGEIEIGCDYCDNTATRIIPVYNPADSIRGVEGIYCEVNICDGCEEEGYLYDDYFTCEGCGKWFILNHSWDTLAVRIRELGLYCHKCALEIIEPVSIKEVIQALEDEIPNFFIRMNIPDSATVIWEGDYSQFSDFAGHTSLNSIIREIKEKCKEEKISLDTEVYAVVSHTFQFSIELALFTM